MKRAKLILEDGSAWTGAGFGHEGCAVGEISFTTLMGGTSEQMTDPRCYSQLIAHTFPMIGNYGVPEGLGRAWPAGVIARELCESPSNYRCAGTLNDYLADYKIPGISGVDTRGIMRRIHAAGPQIGAVVPQDMPAEEALARIRTYVAPAPPKPQTATLPALPRTKFNGLRVALVDFGAGEPLARAINQYGCAVQCYPYDTSADQILKAKPDGIFLSDGFGDPAIFTSAKDIIKALAACNKPILTNGTGLLALTEALGGSTRRMPHPHRGGNQPVRETRTGRLMITAQYHGYETDNLPAGASATYVNLHGGSIEGYALMGRPISGVQFDLTPQSGPHDPSTILKDFIYSMAEVAKACQL